MRSLKKEDQPTRENYEAKCVTKEIHFEVIGQTTEKACEEQNPDDQKHTETLTKKGEAKEEKKVGKKEERKGETKEDGKKKKGDMIEEAFRRRERKPVKRTKEQEQKAKAFDKKAQNLIEYFQQKLNSLGPK